MEACGFRDAFSKISKTGTLVYGISADTPAKQKKFKEKYELPFPLLSDTDKMVCKQFDVIKDKNMYGKLVKGIARTTFVINSEGKVARVFENVKPEGHAEEVLAAVAVPHG